MTLHDIISFNKGFKSGINLYLSLNKEEKIRSYIPTASSLRILDDYLQAALQNKEQATLLIGPYGKGKSHLLLVLLAILSMERNKKNTKIMDSLISRINAEDELDNSVKETIKEAWKARPFLPIILNSTNGDLNQAFLMALNEALTRAKLSGLVPDTFYSLALSRIDDWKQNYPDTYKHFEDQLDQRGVNKDEFQASLKMFSSDALTLFKEIYPTVTSGSEFNPLAVSDVLPLYKNISEQLVENYGYSGIYIVFDEFSKFIEGQDGKLIGNNMKLLQDICELASDSQNAKVFVTMVAHKSIKEYGKYLSQETINAFTGIEGRIVEKYFVTSSKNNYELIKDAIVKQDSYEKLVPDNDAIFGDKAEERYYAVSSAQTKKARLNIITALLTNTDDEEFYAGTNQEATVYRSLFIRTGLKGQQVAPDRYLLEVINAINGFIDSCSDNKTSISGLIHKLTSAPYGMRKGVLPIYLAYAFSERNEDLIFYLSGMEVQLDANVVVNLVEEADEYELFVSKRDVEKEKYLGELNTLFKVTEQRNLTDNRIKNIVTCIQRWFRNLPQTTRNMANSDLVEEKDGIKDYMRGVRSLLQQPEVNPYEMLFVSLPEVFGTEEFSMIGNRLAEVVTAFEDYLDQVVSIVLKKTCEINA